MTAQLTALSVDAHDPPALARFWAGVLGRAVADDPRGGVALLPGPADGFAIRFVGTDVPRRGPNQMHFDLTSTSVEDQQRTVARALALGGRHLDVGQLPEERHVVLADHGDHQTEVDRLLGLGARHVDIGQGEVDWVVLADPDGHEFCVLPVLPVRASG